MAASWQRVAASGVDPGGAPEIAPLTQPEVERRRTASGMDRFLPLFTESLRAVLEAGQMLVLTDADGRVLWRRGTPAVRAMADRLGFVGGSAWTEANVGTNAIGTALVLGEPVHIHGPEHFVDAHTRWGCAAAPVIDPWTGRTVGVVDVSGPSTSMHGAGLAAVALAARVASLELVHERHRALDRLRTRFAPLPARVSGPVVVVDEDGHVALSSGLQLADVITLPRDLVPGEVWLPTLGTVIAEPLAGGWLLRIGADPGSATALVLDLSGPPTARVHGAAGSWSHRLTPRHAELMLALVLSGHEGATAAELADLLFADATREVTVRAELSRLRRALGTILCARPYRVAGGVRTQILLPRDGRAALPDSSAPVVRLLAARAAARDRTVQIDHPPEGAGNAPGDGSSLYRSHPRC